MNIAVKPNSFSIIDEWMSSSSASKLVTDSQLPSEISKTNIRSSTSSNRVGLGKTTAQKSKVIHDNLHERIEQNNSKKQKKLKRETDDGDMKTGITQGIDDDDDDDVGVQLHGVVESAEESKLSRVQNKKSSNNKINQSNTNTNNLNTKTSHSNQQTTKESTQPMTKPEKHDVFRKDFPSANNHDNDQLNHHSADSHFNNNTNPNMNSNSYPYKRKKIRSKQKNIRKDNRPEEAKPKHLQIGSDEYAGRELTQVDLTPCSHLIYNVMVVTPVFVPSFLDTIMHKFNYYVHGCLLYFSI